MTFVASLRGCVRKLLPPGNRGPLDSEYRQPNGDTHVASGSPPGASGR